MARVHFLAALALAGLSACASPTHAPPRDRAAARFDALSVPTPAFADSAATSHDATQGQEDERGGIMIGSGS